MHFRLSTPKSLRSSLTALAFAAAALGATSSAFAGPKDKEAQKLFDAAINEDYLNADFAKAEAKLKDAVGKCGSSGCTPELLGKINVALGTVYVVGLSKPADAKAAYIAALKADPKAALDPSLTTPEATKLFEEAKKSGGGSSAPKPTAGATGDAQHTPPTESPVNTPLPIYVEPSEEVPLAKVVLRYKPFGEKEYKSVELKKLGKGYGGEVPCGDVTTTGDIKYFFAFTGTDGESAGTLGSSKEPYRTTIKNEIEGDPPKLPGKKAPTKCKETTCPPGFGGADCSVMVNAGDKSACSKRGDKGWGSSCGEACDCKEGLTCLNGSCEEDKGGTSSGNEPKKRMNLVSVGVQLDMSLVSGADDVCTLTSEAAKSYACFTPGTSNQFFGAPNKYKETNRVQGGFAYGDIRIIAGYDRQLVRSVPLSIGVRVGFAIGGSPTPDNVPMGSGLNGALGFLPLHAELRASYHFLGSMMDDKKFRPYVFLAPIGFAQVNAAVPVTVCGAGGPGTTPATKNCPDGAGGLYELNAYQITGRNFSGLGVGTTFGITPLFGLYAEAKVMFMWPTFGVVLSPTVGPVFNF